MYAVVKVMRGIFGYNTPKKTDKRFCKTLDEAKEYLRKSYVEMIAREEEVKDIHIVYAYLQGKDIDSTAMVFSRKPRRANPKRNFIIHGPSKKPMFRTPWRPSRGFLLKSGWEIRECVL